MSVAPELVVMESVALELAALESVALQSLGLESSQECRSSQWTTDYQQPMNQISPTSHQTLDTDLD